MPDELLRVATAYNKVKKLLEEETKTLKLVDVVEAIRYLWSRQIMPDYDRGILADVAYYQAQYRYNTAFTTAVDHLKNLLAYRRRKGAITCEALNKVAELLSKDSGSGTAKQDSYESARSQSSCPPRTYFFGDTGYADSSFPRDTSGTNGGQPHASSDPRTKATKAAEPIKADHNKFRFDIEDDFEKVRGDTKYDTSSLQRTREAIIAYRMATIDSVKAENSQTLKPGEEKKAMEKAMELTGDDIKWLRDQLKKGPDT